MGDNGGEYYDLKEKSKRLDAPQAPKYPMLYLDKDKILEIFKGAKIGDEYIIQAKCVLSGDCLDIRGIKLIGTQEDKMPKDKEEGLESEPMDESGMSSEGESE